MLRWDHTADVRLRIELAARQAREEQEARRGLDLGRSRANASAGGPHHRIHRFVVGRGWLARPAAKPNATEA
jgi:hypothetical protein